MAKSQLRSTKEQKKPKKPKQTVVAHPTSFITQPNPHHQHKTKH